MRNDAKPKLSTDWRLFNLYINILIVFVYDGFQPKKEFISIDLLNLVESKCVHIRVHLHIALPQPHLTLLEIELNQWSVFLLIDFVYFARHCQHFVWVATKRYECTLRNAQYCFAKLFKTSDFDSYTWSTFLNHTDVGRVLKVAFGGLLFLVDYLNIHLSKHTTIVLYFRADHAGETLVLVNFLNKRPDFVVGQANLDFV